jgi:hypothetical protein
LLSRKETRVVALANPRLLRCDLLNPVIHAVGCVLSYSVHVSKYEADSMNVYSILQLELQREKEPFLLFAESVVQIIIRRWSATGPPEVGCAGNVGRK